MSSPFATMALLAFYPVAQAYSQSEGSSVRSNSLVPPFARPPLLHTFSFRALAMLLALLLLALPASAQQSGPASADSSKPTIKVTTRLVVLDVVVKDKVGNPVADLTKDDFQVFENNQPQTIAFFEPPIDPASFLTANPGPAGAALLAATLPRTILVLDQLNTRSEDLMFAKEKIRSFLLSQPPYLSQPTSLFSLNKRRLEMLAGPTQDRDALLAVFKKSIIELPPVTLESGGVQGGAERLLTSLLALDELALSSAHQKGRKNIVWVGNGIPILSATTTNLGDLARFREWVHYTANWLEETQATVYTVDPRGLEVAPEGFVADLGGTILSQPGLTPTELVFESIAPESGGAIFRRRNDVDVTIATAVRDGFSYYTLSYYPTNHTWDSKFRPIRVAVERPGVSARTQLGYYAFPEGFEGGAAQIEFGLSRAVTSPIPFRSIVFTATGQILPALPPQPLPPSQTQPALAHRPNTKGVRPNVLTARVLLAIDRESLSWTPQPNGDQRSEVTLVTSSIASSGRVLWYRVREEEIILEKSKLQDPVSNLIKISVRMDLPPKTDHLRLVVRDADSAHLGTFDVPASALSPAPRQ
jgi:VWFA-related protein